ncbi:hypothetical protein A9507_05085 [Methanobacterium sp. A39]|uniref:Transglutaminase-like domain-containing protein n=1 Tax=Methanobacterium bryantii TaxID=2161 RepID=A0A2A2H5D2_METBR|nr:hypothetical protein A9507_05085 [Methanobacterium sp. A39]PAV04483.1 hypothetical protein ASJ80_06500 [Methanobacterium bryantii]
MCALLLVVGMAVGICPSIAGASDQNASDNNAQIGLQKHTNVLEVNAASTIKVKVWYKHWYKSHGKWRYVWKYYYKYKTSTAKAASSYSSSSYTSSSKANTFSDPKLNSIMKSAAGYGYRSGVSTASGLVKYKAGDCWAYSAYLDSKFKAAGYKSRVIQYATSYSSRHRSVQLYQEGTWKTVPYRAYGYNYLIV